MLCKGTYSTFYIKVIFHYRNLKCGLLHCTGGDDEPKVDAKTNAVSSSVDYDGHRFQCK